VNPAQSAPRTDPLAGLPPAIRKQLREGFVEEAATLIEELEAALLILEHQPDDEETMNAAFRAAHTIKGSAAGIGFLGVADFTHHLEDTLDAIRRKEQSLATDTLSAMLEGVDLIRALLEADQRGTEGPDTSGCLARLLRDDSLRVALSAALTSPSLVSVERMPDTAAFAGLRTIHVDTLRDEVGADAQVYAISFRLSADAFQRGLDPVSLLSSLSDEARVIRTVADLDRLPSLDDLDPLVSYLRFSLIVATQASEADLRAVFDFCPEGSEVEVTHYERSHLALVAAHKADHASKPERREGWRQLGEILIEEHLLAPEELEFALEQQHTRGPIAAIAPSRQEAVGDEGRTVRVKQAKLDQLINLIGELVTARNALLHLQRVGETEYDVPELFKRMKDTSAVINRSVSQLQTDVLSLRMVPVRTSFQRLPRVVRDVASKQGKLVDLQMLGEDTELDKTVADGLVDPLVHILRNSVDHGVESAEARRQAGKPETGSVRVEARREGNGVLIEVSDDGQGIDPTRIRRAAISKGLITEDAGARLSDTESLDLIFAAGLSTAAEITDVSGRGVGMDVVKSNIVRMGGVVSVSSEIGKCTTIRLQLPLTLSVFRAMLVNAGGEAFALPLEAIRETASVSPTEWHTMRGRPVARLGGELVGLVPLTDALGMRWNASAPIEASKDLLVIVVDGGGERVGLVVDALEQPQEIMVKPVEAYLSASGAISGASVMGDGRVALVLEPVATVALALAYTQSMAAIGEAA
jgi:two-component system, chemotaxis family, sensor kinase CheA